MATPTQGAFVNIYKNRRFYIQAFSCNARGSPQSGHSALEKHPIDASNEALGASVRKCIHNRNPGHYVPHMHKEREAYLAWRKAYLNDREVESDEDFNKNTISFDVYLLDDRIEFSVYCENPARWEPRVTLSLDATDAQLGQAMRQTYQYLLEQGGRGSADLP